MYNMYAVDIQYLTWYEKILNILNYKISQSISNNYIVIAITSLIVTFTIVLLAILLGYILNMISRLLCKSMSMIFGNKIGKLLYNIATFPGVVIHELSHLVVAIITLSKVKKVEFFKLNIFSNSNALGKVEFIPRGTKWMKSLQMVLTASAPVYIGTFLVYKIINSLSTDNIIKFILNIYLIISISLHCELSKQDIKVIKEGLARTILVIFVIIYIILYNYY